MIKCFFRGYVAPVILSIMSVVAVAETGNSQNDSFSRAKRLLQQQIYTEQDNRRTVYCQASFNADKNIRLPDGFTTDKHLKRASRVEWEHVVPAENFGRSFSAWREGDEQCVNSKGRSYKGRRCAEKVSMAYRYMQADMFNLQPAIGSVNAARSNYNFAMLADQDSDFGRCDMRIDNRKVQPPKIARGVIARSYLYMEQSYSRYSMSASQRKLMQAWDVQYPVTSWECERAQRISDLQHNTNAVVSSRCDALGL